MARGAGYGYAIPTAPLPSNSGKEVKDNVLWWVIEQGLKTFKEMDFQSVKLEEIIKIRVYLTPASGAQRF